MSWKPGVKVGDCESWVFNGMRFETKKESDRYLLDLQGRWTLVTDAQSFESEDPVNFSFVGGRSKSVGTFVISEIKVLDK